MTQRKKYDKPVTPPELNTPLYLAPNEVAEVLRVATGTVYRMLQNNQLKHIRILTSGKRGIYRIHVDDLRKYISPLDDTKDRDLPKED